MTWGLYFLAVVLTAVIIPMIYVSMFPDLTDFIVRVSPEAIGVLPILFLGWFPGFVVCVPAFLIRILVIRFWPNLLPDKYGKH